MDALTKEQLVVYVYVQVITFVESFLIYVRWDQVWGAGGHSKGQSRSMISSHAHDGQRKLPLGKYAYRAQSNWTTEIP